MERKNLIRSALTVRGKSGRFNRAASHRGIRLAPLLLAAVMLAAVAVLAETSNPAQTAQAQNYGNVVCQSPPAESCPTYDDVVSAEGFEIWSATMTVGMRTFSGLTFHGWNDSGQYIGSSLTDQDFTFGGDTYEIGEISVGPVALVLRFDSVIAGDIATQATRDKLVLHVGSDSFNLGAGTLQGNQRTIVWASTGLTWSAGDSVAVKITGPSPPNAYGYRTIWTALMTAEVSPMDSAFVGYDHVAGTSIGEITNNLIVDGRDETVTIGTGDQPQFPWTGYKIELLADSTNRLQITFDANSYPTDDEVAGWTLTLGGGVELPFTDAPAIHANTPWIRQFTYDPNWTDGQQVVVSIRTDEVQNRLDRVTSGEEDRAGQVKFNRVRRSTSVSGGNIVYGKTHFSYDHEPNGGKFRGKGDSWELLRLNVTTDKTGDTDPVWISATFRAHSTGAAERAYQGYWEGEFEDFHTLFLRWIYHEGGIGKGEATYTLPLRSAAKEGGISYRARYDGRPDNYHVSGGHDVTFTWVRTYKEFKDKHLDLANQSGMSAHMLAPPRPATARAGGEGGDGDNLQRVLRSDHRYVRGFHLQSGQ